MSDDKFVEVTLLQRIKIQQNLTAPVWFFDTFFPNIPKEATRSLNARVSAICRGRVSKHAPK